MATLTTQETTPVATLRRALKVLEVIDPPADVGVTLDAGATTIPPSVSLHPRTLADHEAIWRRLALCEWIGDPDWSWIKVPVRGVDVVLHDVRGAAA